MEKEYGIYEKIYFMNKNEFYRLEKRMTISQTLAFFSIFIFLIMVCIQVKMRSIQYLYFLLPILVGIISFTIYMNSYLRTKDIFENSKKLIFTGVEKTENCSLSSFITYTSVNIIALFLIFYSVSLSLKLDNISIFRDVEFNLLAVPIYLSLSILIFYFIFISPALFSNKYYFEIALISSYLIGGFIFFILINTKLDRGGNYTYLLAFIPIIIPFSLHFIHALYDSFNAVLSDDPVNVIGLDTIILKFNFFLSISFILASSILIPMQLDKHQGAFKQFPMDDYVPILLFILGYTFIMIERFYLIYQESLISSNNEEEKQPLFTANKAN
jgi:hypothetical protein